MRVAIVTFASVVAVAVALALTAPAAPNPEPQRVAQYSAHLPTFGDNTALPAAAAKREADRVTWLEAVLHVKQAEQRAAAEAARAAAQRRQQTVGAISGDCASMKPAGFPDSIVWRESRGQADARNSRSGAYGCAQILPSHFTSGGCRGMSYAECWAYLWRDGKGASNWACTVESGCRG